MSIIQKILLQVFQKNVSLVGIRKQCIIHKMSFYAVAKGRTTGIFMTWKDCETQVKGFSGAKYKKFDSVVSAQEFISSGSSGGSSSSGTTKTKTQNKNKSIANTSNSNLKRSYSTSSSYQQNNKANVSNINKHDTNNDDSDGWQSSDDLETVLLKQMDDIEKRLNANGKRIDKIFEKASKSSSRKAILIEHSAPKRQKKTSNNEFEEDTEGFVQVYTDGACSANGRNGARAGLGVFWGDGHSQNISEPVSGRATNNCGEIQAATRAIQQAIANGVTKLCINTDSQFLINSVTKWIPGWKRKGWKLASGEPVKNEVDFKELDSIRNKIKIKWNYVEAHRGIHGNEMADQLAKAGAALYVNK